MKQMIRIMLACIAGSSAALATPAALTVNVQGIGSDGAIAEHYAACKATPDGKSAPGDNARPEISWNAGPSGTKSYAVIVIDPDVPADFSEAGKEGHIVRGDAKRQPFFHWGLVDVPADVTKVAGGDSTVAPSTGKQVDEDLKGYVSSTKNFGGPCPPWNDERVHHYHFMVLALDVDSLKLSDTATAKEALAAAMAHAVAQGEAVGSYTLNPLLRGGAPTK